jgi:chemotaxis protein MotB
MIRRRIVEEEQQTDRWLISYADFITLLFAFFVVMYSISSVNEGKYKVMSESLTAVFDSPERSTKPLQVGDINRLPNDISGNNTDPTGAEIDGNTEIDQWGGVTSDKDIDTLKTINNDLAVMLETIVDEGLIDIKMTEDWLEISMNSGLLFKPGSDQLARSAKTLISNIAQVLVNTKNEIRVRGYTDNIPITSTFRSNWALSSARAIAVMELLIQQGVNSFQLAAEGYGEFRPIADNNTRDGRAKNRRVVIAVSKQRVDKELVEALKAASLKQQKDEEPEIELVRQKDGSLLIRVQAKDKNSQGSE